MNARPHPNAANRNLFLSIIMRFEYSGSEAISSDVINKINANTANNKPISETESGKSINFNPQIHRLFQLLIFLGRDLILL